MFIHLDSLSFNDGGRVVRDGPRGVVDDYPKDPLFPSVGDQARYDTSCEDKTPLDHRSLIAQWILFEHQ